jgi:hypothetical protein
MLLSIFGLGSRLERLFSRCFELKLVGVLWAPSRVSQYLPSGRLQRLLLLGTHRFITMQPTAQNYCAHAISCVYSESDLPHSQIEKI